MKRISKEIYSAEKTAASNKLQAGEQLEVLIGSDIRFQAVKTHKKMYNTSVREIDI